MPRVLLVEDLPEIRSKVKESLEKSGFTVVEANDGQDGLAKSNQEQDLDIIITDYHMPQMTGLEMLREIRKIGRYDHVLVIMHTTETGQNLRDEGMELGVRAWVVKPSAPEILSRMAQRLLARQGT